MRWPFVAAISVGIWVVAAQLSPPKQGVIQRTGSANRQKTATANHKQQQSDTDGVRTALTKDQQEESHALAAQTKASNQDIEVQRKLVKYTWALVWVGLLQGIVLLLTVLVIWRQTNFFRNSERSWILIERADFGWNDGIVKWYCPVIINFGKTVVRVKKVCGTGVLNGPKEGLPSKPNFQDASVEELNFVLYPGVEIKPLKIQISKEKLDAFKTNLYKMYLYGFVEYEDFSKKIRYSGFCLVFDPRESNGFARDTRCPPAYNRAT